MGLLNLFSRPARKAALLHLPAGSFTLDREGNVMTSTLPRSFPEEYVKEIGRQVLACFRGAERAQQPMTEIVLNYAALKILARELRGGAMIFLMPQTTSQSPKRN